MVSPRIFLSPPHMSGKELDIVKQAFESNYIAPLGPMVDTFEKEFAEYTGIPHCVALSTGTAAVHLALRHLLGNAEPFGFAQDRRGTRNAEEPPLVLASTFTFIGSVSPATFEGCDITFIDCDRETWNMDPALLAEELEECAKKGRLPAAVMPTDLYGQCCDLPRILEVCGKYDVPVICDSAEAAGSRYLTNGHKKAQEDTKGQIWKHAGYDARAAVYSFNGNKIITTSGGGILASHDKDLIDHARKLATQARDPAPWYEHTEIGFNYRMSNIVAAIGRGQLQVLDERVAQKRQVFEKYLELLGDVSGIEFMTEPEWSRSNRWLTVVLIDPKKFGADTNSVREALEAENIEARPMWKPMHMQPVFQGTSTKMCCSRNTIKDVKYFVRRGEVAEELFAKGLCLPSGTAMTDDDIERICGIVLRKKNVSH